VRKLWVDTLFRIVERPLTYLANGETWPLMNVQEKRGPTIGYLETLARITAGVAPWLASDSTEQATVCRDLVVRAIIENYDKMNWNSIQSLVEAAFLSLGFIRARAALWDPLPELVRKRLIERFKKVLTDQRKRQCTLTNNWILFYGICQALFVMVDAEPDRELIEQVIKTVEGLYIGDGFYSDGELFRIDYYNSYVFHSLYVEMLTVLGEDAKREIAIKRMIRYSEFLENLIAPDGTYPPLGRSIAYRLAVFQPIAHCVLLNRISDKQTYGQLRRALTSVLTNLFIRHDPFSDGFLTLGLCGHQPGIVEDYINSGSLYLTTLGFSVLGLSEDHPFWSAAEESTTQELCWSGKPFPPYKIAGF